MGRTAVEMCNGIALGEEKGPAILLLAGNMPGQVPSSAANPGTRKKLVEAGEIRLDRPRTVERHFGMREAPSFTGGNQVFDQYIRFNDVMHAHLVLRLAGTRMRWARLMQCGNATRFQHPGKFGNGMLLHWNVMERIKADHPIETVVGKRQIRPFQRDELDLELVAQGIRANQLLTDFQCFLRYIHGRDVATEQRKQS